MYTLFDSHALKGQHAVKTWQQDGYRWASYSLYRESASHELYIPHTLLNLVIQGHKRMYDGKQVHHLQAGDVLVIPAGTLLCSEILRPEQQYRSINLVIPDEMVISVLAGAARRQDAYSKELTVQSGDRRWQQLAATLLQGFTEEGNPGFASEDILSQALHLVNSNGALSSMLVKAVKYPLPDMMNQLRTRLPEVRFLEEIAQMGHMSTATVKRRFREIYHCSPMQWIWEKRLQMAGFLLHTTEQPIPEIAYSTGFENITHFYRQFRRCFQVTPLQWRDMETDLFSK
ncbi:AraC family transcriptional regulator [Chitinophaga sp. Ak27]|uniref:AraC family transcriptional regulator n=1 Tax=Chitinophaga sp. Ak27 TaxID=2726116 RepID=UPI00145CE275|nr:AraC family transcriptional regulator [Chitinophaga sp. Ak27]NLU92565.1 AraC family transcriptional regulator [Chitinophaga sp. Ak27]